MKKNHDFSVGDKVRKKESNMGTLEILKLLSNNRCLVSDGKSTPFDLYASDLEKI